MDWPFKFEDASADRAPPAPRPAISPMARGCRQAEQKVVEHLVWAQCDSCDKWRILDQQFDQASLALPLSREDRFTCSMAQRECSEPEDERENPQARHGDALSERQQKFFTLLYADKTQRAWRTFVSM